MPQNAENIDFTTDDFNSFFDDPMVRYIILEIIQKGGKSVFCRDRNQPIGNPLREEIDEELRNNAEELFRGYRRLRLPELRVRDRCNQEDELNNNNNNNWNNNWNNNNNNGNNNNNIPVQNIGSRFLPVNAENTITSNAIEDGNLMVNFQNEFQHGRYYKQSTYNAMQQKKNPYTQAPITALKQYTAVIGAPPLAGGRTRRRRDVMKRRRTKSRK
jgi:hypothetical protein